MSNLKDHISHWHDSHVLMSHRVIYMGSSTTDSEDEESGTDYRMAENALKNLLLLDIISSNPITVIMNNLGGEVAHGMAIYDVIQGCRCHITIVGIGNIQSMGTVILQAADRRILTPNVEFMMHWGSAGTSGHTQDVINDAQRLKEVTEDINKIYLDRIKVARPRFNRKHLRDMILNNKYLTPKEAVELNLADEVKETDIWADLLLKR